MDVAALHIEAKERYWKDKDLAAARHLLEEGISLASEQGDLGAEKPLQYDLASFCWPGWDEPGIVISDDDLRAGEWAADENLRLAQELKRPDPAVANAWFMVGAYHLAFRRFDEADEAFHEYGTVAARAGLNDHVLLSAGLTILALELQRGRRDVSLAARTIED